MAQIGDASCPPRVYGCVLGVLVGRTVGIFNSFELLYDLVAGELCREFLEVKHLQYKKVFPKYDILGCYSTGSDVLDSYMHIHKAVRVWESQEIYASK